MTLGTDLDNKQPPFVEVTEGGIFAGHNYSINCGFTFLFPYENIVLEMQLAA